MPVMLCILGAPGPFAGYQEAVVTGIVPTYSYPIIGDSAAAQMESLQLLAQQMQLGQQSLITNIGDIVNFTGNLENLGENPSETVVYQLFSESEGMFYGNQVVCYAAEGSTLMDILGGAGEALAALL